MKLLIHAGGYVKSPWRGDEMKEIRTARGEVNFRNSEKKDVKCVWSPTTVDFAAAGIASGTGSSAASTVAGLIQVIAAQQVESIEELRIIGHGNGQALALAGTTTCDNVDFDVEPAVIGDFDTFNAAIPKCREVQDRFTQDAKVILMGCNGGSGSKELLSHLSHAFLRRVEGFKEKVQYSLDITTDLKTGQSHITGRGRMLYEDIRRNPLGLPPNKNSNWTNPWLLTPDAKNNDGDVYGGMRAQDPARGASLLFWRLLQEFYSPPFAKADHPYVSGTSVDAGCPGLRVTWLDASSRTVSRDGVTHTTARGASVEISSQFAAKTTPKTLTNRVAEIGKALELVAAKQSGVIPATW